MRFAALFSGVVLVCGCSSISVGDSCPSPVRTGAAPTCVLTAQCVSTNVGVKLDCSKGDGNCVCAENGVDGDSVSYQDSFCGDDKTKALEAANSACGWKL